jgi:ribulose kinase
VAQGGSDAFIGMVGLGVVRAGQMAMLTGSSHLQLGMSDQPLHGQGFFGTYPGAPGSAVHVGNRVGLGGVRLFGLLAQQLIKRHLNLFGHTHITPMPPNVLPTSHQHWHTNVTTMSHSCLLD